MAKNNIEIFCIPTSRQREHFNMSYFYAHTYMRTLLIFLKCLIVTVMMPFYPRILQCVFSKNKGILLYNHCSYQFWEINIDKILLSNPHTLKIILTSLKF